MCCDFLPPDLLVLLTVPITSHYENVITIACPKLWWFSQFLLEKEATDYKNIWNYTCQVPLNQLRLLQTDVHNIHIPKFCALSFVRCWRLQNHKENGDYTCIFIMTNIRKAMHRLMHLRYTVDCVTLHCYATLTYIKPTYGLWQSPSQQCHYKIIYHISTCTTCKLHNMTMAVIKPYMSHVFNSW